jgi:hypothetical protein
MSAWKADALPLGHTREIQVKLGILTSGFGKFLTHLSDFLKPMGTIQNHLTL